MLYDVRTREYYPYLQETQQWKNENKKEKKDCRAPFNPKRVHVGLTGYDPAAQSKKARRADGIHDPAAQSKKARMQCGLIPFNKNTKKDLELNIEQWCWFSTEPTRCNIMRSIAFIGLTVKR